MDQFEKFVTDFFKNLKCNVSKDGDILVVSRVPKNFEDLFGKISPYRLSFSSSRDNVEFAGKGSFLLATITKFLEGVGKTTLLKIDFNCDAELEISKVINLKNCEVSNLVKRHRNNFFLRFTFITTFRYLNESEQVINEIYLHDGKIVEGDLTGYTIVEGNSKDVEFLDSVVNKKRILGKVTMSPVTIERDYKIAREYLKGVLNKKTAEISNFLGSKADAEIERVREHYENLLSELGGDLSGQLKKVREAELSLRVADNSNKDVLRVKLNRLRKSLIKVGDDDAQNRILKEQNFTIKDVMHKYSLGIDNKLVNTTVIYYPIFNFNLFLKGARNSGRFLDMSYNPLTKTLNRITCEGCGSAINDLNLCQGGHICCDNCLRKCGECGGQFCVKCLTRSCSCCGKALCKGCAKVCIGCGKNVCSDHMRTDCVSGDERCVNCLRACMRCHGLSDAKYFSEALDGSKVCQKCLGIEKRGMVMDRIFND